MAAPAPIPPSMTTTVATTAILRFLKRVNLFPPALASTVRPSLEAAHENTMKARRHSLPGGSEAPIREPRLPEADGLDVRFSGPLGHRAQPIAASRGL